MNAPRRAPDGLVRMATQRLVTVTVAGTVRHPRLGAPPFRITREGRVLVVPGSGGIVLDRRVGDAALGMAGDHVEPGVSVRTEGKPENRALLGLSCIGNEAVVLDGPAEGSRGVVVGKHGGIDNLIVDLPLKVRRLMRIGDRVQVTARGQGLTFPELPEVMALNLSPELVARWGLVVEGGALRAPVTHLVPGGWLGSGLGKPHGVLGDCDVQLTNPEAMVRLRLDRLRLGDLVCVVGMDWRWGPSRRRDLVSVGVVVHGDSAVAGHGPGITPLLVGPMSHLRPTFSAQANLAALLGLRRRLSPLPGPAASEERRWKALGAGKLAPRRRP